MWDLQNSGQASVHAFTQNSCEKAQRHGQIPQREDDALLGIHQYLYRYAFGLRHVAVLSSVRQLRTGDFSVHPADEGCTPSHQCLGTEKLNQKDDTYYDESEKECNAFLLQYLKENKEHFMKES